MALAKSSVLWLQRRLCGDHSTTRYVKIVYPTLGVFILLWTAFSVFALALQCGAARPQYYLPERCADGAWWYPVTIGNAATDAALAVWFTPIILSLNTRTRLKVKVIALMGSRIV